MQMINKVFTHVASRLAFWAGQPIVFAIALFLIIAWAITGPYVGYSETWQLAVNTGTTIITFLMVFVIQNSQNRDSAAIQIKLDELIRVSKGSPDALLDLEEMPIEELEALRQQYINHAVKARKGRKKTEKDDCPV
jgi:low affinity Fe/Cu permease